MFRKKKLEIRLVNDDQRANETQTSTEPKPDYVAIADEAAARLGKKLIVGVVVTLAAAAVISVVANAADTALQNALTTE
ncbi:hypothetical protein PBI_CAMILLE_33 [Microbacterium phage Camille]|nr:hypothetical protein PBI_CAMILLE_33 [Microbacterium phage Camille]